MMSSSNAVSVFLLLALFLLPVQGIVQDCHAEDVKTPEEATKEIEVDTEELLESELPKTQFNYELDISMKPNAEDIFKKDYIRTPLNIKYGLTDNLEVYVEPRLYIYNFFKGLWGVSTTDVVFGTKYRFGDLFEPYVRTAFSYSIVVPVNSNTELSDGWYHYRPALLFSRKSAGTKDLIYALSVGADMVRDPGPGPDPRPNDTMKLGLGTRYRKGRMNYSLEATYVTDEVDQGTYRAVFLTPGVFTDKPDWLSRLPGIWTFGVGLRVGFLDEADTYEFIVKAKLNLRLDYTFDFKEMRLKKRK